MIRSTRLSVAAPLFPFILFFTIISYGQDRSLPEDEFYGDIKVALSSHYTGKIVKVRQKIPATRRGLEIVDGALQNSSSPTPQLALAQPGDVLVIKNIRVNDADIEVVLGKIDSTPKKRFSNPFAAPKQPRIQIRFSREITAKDLSIENINRMLSLAVDVSSLAPQASEKSVAPGEAPTTATQAETPGRTANVAPAERLINEQVLPAAQIVGDLPALSPRVGELTVECSAKQARVYIDGSYSGIAPRTIRLRAGIHTVLVVSEGLPPWEQRIFVTGAKASVVRAELR